MSTLSAKIIMVRQRAGMLTNNQKIAAKNGEYSVLKKLGFNSVELDAKTKAREIAEKWNEMGIKITPSQVLKYL